MSATRPVMVVVDWPIEHAGLAARMDRDPEVAVAAKAAAALLLDAATR
jgi:hypothetical protein